MTHRMTRTTRTTTAARAVAGLALGGALALAPGTAGAATASTATAIATVTEPQDASTSATVRDRAGDAGRAVDLTRLRVHLGGGRLTATARIPGLRAGHLSGTELLVKPTARARTYAAGWLRDRRGRLQERALSWRPVNDPVEPAAIECAGMTTSLGARRVTVSLPTSCLRRTASSADVHLRMRLTDGTRGLDGPYYDEQTRWTPLIALRGSEAGVPRGTVTTDGSLLVRALPTTRSGVRATVAGGSTVHLPCRTAGRRVADGEGHATRRWYRLGNGRYQYVSALYVRPTGVRPPVCA